MDAASYKSLLSKTQEALNCDATVKLVSSFDILLKDCVICIQQCLHLLRELLLDAEVCITTLEEYTTDAVILLERLSNSIKGLIGTEQTICWEMKTFPTSVALIIADVFLHCKDSKALSVSNWSRVEKHVMNLFRSCQELQSTYLIMLEKHLVFNVSDMEERTVLLEALNINLRIGETLQFLDATLMVVQWKTIIAVYKKYSTTLSDTGVLQDCMAVLCPLIKSNIGIAVEANEDEKRVMRYLKVASFSLKILQKACDILESATRKEYNNVISLLFYINERQARLQTPAERARFVNSIAGTSEALLVMLLRDETFANDLLGRDIEKLKQEGSFLGFVLTFTSVMDGLTQGLIINKNITKTKMITRLYDILTKCNSWNLNVTLWSDQSQRSHGLFEYLLIHALALAMTLNCEDYCVLEKHMAEAILGTEHVRALFSTNIWASLHKARGTNPQLLHNQVIWLCTMYKNLEKHAMFPISPIHLTHTIARLFSLMGNDDKIRICKQVRIHDDDNLSLWAALGVKSLPQEAKNAAEAVVAGKLKMELQCVASNTSIGPEEIDKLIKVMTVAATCTFARGSGITEYVMRAWSKTCPKRFAITHALGTAWFHRYLRALVALTDAIWHHLSTNNVHLIEMFHYVTGLIQQCGVDLKLLFINILCKLATTDICEGKLNDFTAAFTCLYRSEDIVRNKLFVTLKQYTHNNIDRILFNGDNSLYENWTQIKNRPNCIDVKDDIEVNFEYVHKCLENIDMVTAPNVVLGKRPSGNFDVPNVENLFENDNDFEESAPKKVKLDNSVEAIVRTLESETALLRAMKENVSSAECRSRIKNVCDELNNIIN